MRLIFCNPTFIILRFDSNVTLKPVKIRTIMPENINTRLRFEVVQIDCMIRDCLRKKRQIGLTETQCTCLCLELRRNTLPNAVVKAFLFKQPVTLCARLLMIKTIPSYHIGFTSNKNSDNCSKRMKLLGVI